ncbi:predicted protein [Coccidioides posadasii str. Silveira]|uniref:Predicted protein n=1 Tax=Coccidioides posadasii (strain RMSCC 757 / Silveira) TaxID=443226 RepID=E9D2Y1_COCPS|nr:predicted protein [Coccidioides posadasii str. Silveira]
MLEPSQANPSLRQSESGKKTATPIPRNLAAFLSHEALAEGGGAFSQILAQTTLHAAPEQKEGRFAG